MTEYRGAHSGDPRGRTMFECVDRDQEPFIGSHPNTNGVLFHHVEALLAMAFHVHLTIRTKNLIVWCALSS